MAYTEFRKSYGDFEVVIPPVKFQLPQNMQPTSPRSCAPTRSGSCVTI